MNRVQQVFKKKKKALIAYVTVGFPSIEATLAVVPELVKNGADIVELGIPFSDPLADGTTIQHASFKALNNGVTPDICFQVAAKLRKQVPVPLVFMTYFNPVLQYGIDRFFRKCKSAGVDGIIVPDLLPEEGQQLESSARQNDIDVIYLLAPTSTDQRIKKVAARSRGFIYLVSVNGITGVRRELPSDLPRFLARVRKITKTPLCVGFGIATPEQARQVAQYADGVIIGSKLIQLIEEDPSMKMVGRFIAGVRDALDFTVRQP